MNSIRRYNLYLLNICDILSIILSFAMSYIIRFFIMRDIVFDETRINNYILLLAIIIFAYIIYNYVYLYKQWNYLNRKTLEESLECCKMDLFVVSLVIIFLNFIKYNTLYSRIFEAIFFICFLCFSLISRSLLKRYINKTSFRLNNTEKLLIIGNYDNVFSFLNDLNNDYRYSPAGIILTDSKYNKVKDVDVIAGNDNFKEIPASFIYDSVLIIPDSKTDKLAEWINYFISAGKIVHLKLIEYDYAPVNKNIDVIGTTPIINYRMLEPMSKRQQILKRSLDIVFSLLLIIPVLILYIIVFVLTNLESPGSVIISRLRVGKNNNLFNQYRFRIYRLDAKKRIQQHKSPCTIIGSFLLFFHLDGAPMIINISTDSMSFIGPKAPNLVKYLNMSAQEKNILNIRPGVMGYWSVLSDPQQILKKEKTYIEQWSVIKDIAILFSTQLRYLFFKSLRYDGKEHQKEELAFIDQINKDNQPLSYEHNYIRERERERDLLLIYHIYLLKEYSISLFLLLA